ncbi:hypothetical protein BDZ97DRAFT_1926170 [Flammula alnicola]|nr:hypothetical protein BDZ97DRAFT_1926170 [Flammula alnicola]
MATLSADSDHSTMISCRSLIDTTLARLKDATLQFDADYLRPSACHSTGLDIIGQLAADACALHLSPEYVAAHPDEPILVLHLTPDPDARFLDLLKQLVPLQNVARQLANAALFNKLHRFLVHRYVHLLGLSKDEIADFYAEGVAEASTIRSARQVTPFERD